MKKQALTGAAAAVLTAALLTSSQALALIGSPPPRLMAPHEGGIPVNLEAERTDFDTSLLEALAATLPEKRDLAETNADLIKKDRLRNLHFKANARLTVSFLHEGTPKLNSTGIFRYKTNEPPALPFEVERLVVFPNASLKGGGGKLEAGHAVDAGEVKAGHSIGFFLISGGFTRNEVTEGSWTVYSVDELNAAGYFGKSAHTVLLQTDTPGRYVIGFEDVLRTRGSDHDFNDVMLVIDVDPPEAVAPADYARLTPPRDSDADGIADHEDDYPDDKSRAFRSQYPKQGKFGVIAYEDSWPSKGDYDFNDLVVSYHVIEARNADGRLVDVEIVYAALAVGASRRNGLALRLPVERDLVTRLTRAKGGEDPQPWHVLGHQTDATAVVFADASDLLKPPYGFDHANTQLGSPAVKGDDVRLRFFFGEPLPTHALGPAPYDTFLFRDETEVHLPGYPPTNMVNRDLLGTSDDATDISAGYTFKTAQGLPWALLVPEAWRHPCEGVSIDRSYRHFTDWAATAGREHRTWYDKPSAADTVWSDLATSALSE